MSEVVLSEAITSVLSSIRTQVDVITALSSGGLGSIIFTWARVLGLFEDGNFKSFKSPFLLVIPGALLLIAVILGYLVGAQITGFLTEIANGTSAQGDKIIDASAYYFSSVYSTSFDWMMLIQLLASSIGIIMIACWFAWNVKKKQTDIGDENGKKKSTS
ncbi:hypothetical protein [Amylibacter sp. IMCC11727]|uniref:hypothetical protein n=1 Tax=Amylibacter sp. IMCC11727 TaxID=3039851 RepID=UPI00244DC253|nr:hypothetical protein [Amylibacter sp. IMCC11727]WGI22819.1 hypothetical protein QBD29_05215 [Amylibacter sp. IMCC11727]